MTFFFTWITRCCDMLEVEKVIRMYKIMIVEDEYHIRHIVKEYFRLKGIEVIEASQGYEAIDKMDSSIQLVLLDIMMPGIDGYEVCKQIRQNYDVPLIFISALSEDDNQLKAYELGADDYITKPFQPSILYAKCHAMIKRNLKNEEKYLDFGHVQLDPINHVLVIDHKPIVLAHKEFELLYYLMNNASHLLTREQILDKVWGYDYYGDGRAVDTYIKMLRKKLGCYSHYIQTVIKTGYMFKVVDENENDTL